MLFVIEIVVQAKDAVLVGGVGRVDVLQQLDLVQRLVEVVLVVLRFLRMIILYYIILYYIILYYIILYYITLYYIIFYYIILYYFILIC